MVFVFSVNVSSLVRYSIDSGPRFLRCWMHMLSGPVDVLFLACFIAMRVCVFVIMIFSLGNFLIVLFIFLVSFVVLCAVMLVKVLLKLLAKSKLVIKGLLLKVCLLLFYQVVEEDFDLINFVLFSIDCLVFVCCLLFLSLLSSIVLFCDL